MPRHKSQRLPRKCLVCGGTTHVAHLGLDFCRACTVFYRRSRSREFACRSNSNSCPIGEGVNCRKCRLKEMERVLAEHPNKASIIATKEEIASPIQATIDHSPSQPSTSSAASPACPPCSMTVFVDQPMVDGESKSHRLTLMAKLKHCYRSMCETRLSGELASRRDAPHPLAVVDGQFPIAPATYNSLEISNRLYLTALLQFGSNAFVDFAELSVKDRWTIVANFFSRFHIFESSYRADRAFPDDLEKTFAGYTMYFATGVAEHFFDECPLSEVERNEAKRLMANKFKMDLRGTRSRMRRVALKHDEFLAVLAIMFWTTEGLDVSEETSKASEMYKEKVLKELHILFREDWKMDNYAARLGEILMLLQVYEQKSAALDQHYELLRLLNVFKEESLVYRLA